MQQFLFLRINVQIKVNTKTEKYETVNRLLSDLQCDRNSNADDASAVIDANPSRDSLRPKKVLTEFHNDATRLVRLIEARSLDSPASCIPSERQLLLDTLSEATSSISSRSLLLISFGIRTFTIK